jgi:hypothetical protein
MTAKKLRTKKSAARPRAFEEVRAANLADPFHAARIARLESGERFDDPTANSNDQWEWEVSSDEDYDVLADGKVVGRILEEGSRFDPPELRWGWSITEIVPATPGVTNGTGRANKRWRGFGRRGRSRNIGPAEGFAISRKQSRATSQSSAPIRKRLRPRVLGGLNECCNLRQATRLSDLHPGSMPTSCF